MFSLNYNDQNHLSTLSKLLFLFFIISISTKVSGQKFILGGGYTHTNSLGNANEFAMTGFYYNRSNHNSLYFGVALNADGLGEMGIQFSKYDTEVKAHQCGIIGCSGFEANEEKYAVELIKYIEHLSIKYMDFQFELGARSRYYVSTSITGFYDTFGNKTPIENSDFKDNNIHFDILGRISTPSLKITKALSMRPSYVVSYNINKTKIPHNYDYSKRLLSHTFQLAIVYSIDGA
ncbi:MAG: hypothetical protein V3V14_06655 [Saprospiraceae bacterium]